MPNLFRHNQHLYLFLAISVLIHAGVIALLSWWPKEAVMLPSLSAPFYVEVKEIPQPRVIDTPVTTPVPRRETPAKRLGPENQLAPKESAPTPAVTEAPPVVIRSTAAPLVPPSGLELAPIQPLPQLSRDQLFASLDRAVHNVVAQWQEKHQEEVERGDAVWFDMEKDLLSSFFSRFRDSIYLVWDYPATAAKHGIEGTTLLKIDINRAGLVEEAQVIESSGSRLLDETARDAVFKASPHFGYLPSSYPKEKLTIYAFFTYQLGARPSIYNGR